jgi:hypothetical protein
MGSMNIINKSDVLDLALANVNEKFRGRIIKTYLELKHRLIRSFHTKEYDSSGLSSGKFCETVFRILEFELKSGSYTPFSQHIGNLAKELINLEQIPKSAGHESLRIIIPRALLVIYTLRNKRGIGHVGGDVEANQIDATTIVKNADWVIAELIRIYHVLSLEEAQTIIDSINNKAIPDVWEINGKKRILKAGLDYKDKVLLLLYSDVNYGIAVEDLFEWVEYSNMAMFKANVLKGLHRMNLIEFDTELNFVHLSPLGINEVEERILS